MTTLKLLSVSSAPSTRWLALVEDSSISAPSSSSSETLKRAPSGSETTTPSNFRFFDVSFVYTASKRRMR